MLKQLQKSLSPVMCCELPIEIEADEKIVRLVRTPSHVTKNQLKPAAFRSQAGLDEVSVIRHSYMGSDFCKAKGKEIMVDAYVGLAVILAQDIRSTSSTVQDSREEFCGHAHISHGVTLPREEPPNSEMNLFITERCRQLVKATRLHTDPNPSASKWTGPQL